MNAHDEELKAQIRAGKCEEYVRGSIYSRRGGGRFDDCDRDAVYHVKSRLSGYEKNVCRVHARRFLNSNARDVARCRETYYVITEVLA